MPPDHRSAEARALWRNVYICFFFSGALGLVYQILWLRKLILIFGSTVHAVSTVLTVFFGGLALGSWLFGRWIDRHEGEGLRWYGLLEAGVGLYAFATPFLFDAIQQLYIPVYRASGLSPTVLVIAAFACSFLILFVPTVLLGGTFPVITRYIVRTSEARGATIAGLYGLNTAGAMMGTLLVYYVGLPGLGLSRTLLCAGVSSLGIGLLCLVFDRHLRSLSGGAPATAPQPSAALSAEPSPAAMRWLLTAFALSGFSAMVYEVAWTRLLGLVLGSSIYAFCVMLATFLGGMALGSARARQALAKRPATLQEFIMVEFLLGMYGILSLPLFNSLPDLFVSLWPTVGQTFPGLMALQFTLSALIMLVPTVLFGYLFPIVSDLVTSRFEAFGRRLGTAYALNTAGGIAGSFLAGFVLIPSFGLPWAVVIAGLANLVAGGLLYSQSGEARARRLATAVALVAVWAWVAQSAVLPAWKRQVLVAGSFMTPARFQGASVEAGLGDTKLIYYRDSYNTTVSVHQSGDNVFLKVGGKTDASNGIDMGTQVLSAHLPMLLHGDPKRVLVIGLGSGVTLGSVSRHPVTTLDCAEIDEAVIEAARFFKSVNFNVHEDPRVRMFEADGRNFLLAGSDQYDVIISEPSNPWMAGIGYLFTKEFYRLAKRRLASDGVMCQWLQLYHMFPSDVKLMLRTFHDAFPNVTVWSSVPGDLLLVGSMQPQQMTRDTLAARMGKAGVKEDLARVQIDQPDTLLQLFVLGNREVDQLVAGEPWIHEDDLPWLEFSAPKALYSSGSLQVNLQGLRALAGEPRQVVSDYAPSTDPTALKAQASLWMAREQWGEATDTLRRWIEQEPASADAWMMLANVELRQRRQVAGHEALTKAAQLDPGRVEALQQLGRLGRQQGQKEEARRWYERAALARAADLELAKELGDYYASIGEHALSAEYGRSAVSQSDQAEERLFGAFAISLKSTGDLQTAAQAARAGIERFPNERELPVLLGEILAKQGEQAEATVWFERAVALGSRNAAAYAGLAEYLILQDRPDQAQPLLKQGLRYQPYHQRSLELLRKIRQGAAAPSVAQTPSPAS